MTWGDRLDRVLDGLDRLHGAWIGVVVGAALGAGTAVLASLPLLALTGAAAAAVGALLLVAPDEED